MRRGPFIIGVGMLVIGVYLLWLYLQSLSNGAFIDNWPFWMFVLMVGSFLFSFGPCEIVLAYTSSHQASNRQIVKQKLWQGIQLHLECSECGKEISIRSVEWIGEGEARCPFCSKDLEIRMSKPDR